MIDMISKLLEKFRLVKSARGSGIEYTPEEIDLASALVGAGSGAIGTDVQLDRIGPELMNAALTILRTQEDPAAYCWNAFTSQPHRKARHDLDRLRPLILVRLRDEAGGANEAVAALHTIDASRPTR